VHIYFSSAGAQYGGPFLRDEENDYLEPARPEDLFDDPVKITSVFDDCIEFIAFQKELFIGSEMIDTHGHIYENVLEDPNNVVCHKIRGVVDSSYILHITTAYGFLLDRAKEYEAYHKGIEILKDAFSSKPAPKTTKRASTKRK
jgi:hypothetical protein